MKSFLKLFEEIKEHLGGDDVYWNGSIDELKKFIEQINKNNDKEIKQNLYNKLSVLIHLSHKIQPIDSFQYKEIYDSLNNYLIEFVDVFNQKREEFQFHPISFDLLTRSTMTDTELNKYNNELNKKKDDFYKKNKKKHKTIEEEEFELKEYRNSLFNTLKEKLTNNVINSIKETKEINKLALFNNELNSNYIERLSLIKNLKTVKNEGLEGKSAVLRIDITENDYDLVYSENYDDDGNFINKIFKGYDFSKSKEKLFYSLSFLLDNRVRFLILLFDWGNKEAKFDSKFSAKHLIDYFNKEGMIDQQIYYFGDYKELYKLNERIENEEFKENSLFVLENLNSFKEECGFIEDEFFGEDVKINLTDSAKNAFVENFNEAEIFVNDSINSINKCFPTILAMSNKIKCLGLRLDDQISKIPNFLSLEVNKTLIIGDTESILNSLFILNNILLNFNTIYIFGKLALSFISLVQCDFDFGHFSQINENYKLLMKFILIKAKLNNIEIILPEDGFFLNKNEISQFENEDNNLNYMKYIKQLFKKEKKSNELQGFINEDAEEAKEDEDKPDDDENNVEEANNEENFEEENSEILKYKLTDEEKKTLEFYADNQIDFDSNYYLERFVLRQNPQKPKKILKNEIQIKEYMESLYFKPIEFLEQSSKVLLTSNVLDKAIEYSHEDIPVEPNKDDIQEINNEIDVKQNEQEVNNQNLTTNYNGKCLYNPEKFDFVDFGQRSYERLSNLIKISKSIMWIGKTSPSEKINDLYDFYSVIVRTLHDRKNSLKEKLPETLGEVDKVINEADPKIKKHLFNLFLFDETTFNLIKGHYWQLINLLQGNEIEDENEELDDNNIEDNQFKYELGTLINYNISENLEVVSAILRGETIKGLYSLTKEKRIEKEEELDLKFLEEI